MLTSGYATYKRATCLDQSRSEYYIIAILRRYPTIAPPESDEVVSV
jgi:hypothetical protein